MKYLPVLFAAILLIGVSILCSGCYTLKQGATYLGYLSRAVPLESLLKGDDVSEEDRLFVQRVNDIRRFAIEELGLAAGRNYTRYVALDRNFLAAVVSASAKDSFTRHEWWFPVVGRVPYKGFFNVEDARRERARLERRDLDVWIRGVDAFSTLGWFSDPLFTFMRNYSERDLADLIIHELLHATVWINNHAQFNEELAQFVGVEGARLYMKKVRGIIIDESYEADALADRATYLAFIRELIAELDTMFRSDISREEKLIRREEIIAAAKTRFEENYETLFRTDNYRFFIDLPINNAYLELFRLYHEDDHYIKDLFERSGSCLPGFIAAAKTLNNRQIARQIRRHGNPRKELERALGLKP